MDLHDIRNFVPLGESYGTAGQPTEEQLSLIAQHGFEVVVNLGLLDPRYCLPDEQGSVRAAGMSYHHIPVDFRNPTIGDFDRFREIILGSRGRKVFIHCAANLRLSCFMPLLGESDLGWSMEQAEAHFRRLWSPDEVWTRFFEEARVKLRMHTGERGLD